MIPMFPDGHPLPDLDPSPPDPPPHCGDCLAFLDDGECPVCAETEEYAAELARCTRGQLPSLYAQDADDANDRAREQRDERKREGL